MEQLSKRFGALSAVHRVSFEARPGEILGLLGENGAGKTTILRMLATVLKPTEGDALINGHSVLKEPETVRRQLGFLTADAGVYDRLTARENVHYFGQLHGIDEATIRNRIEEIFFRLDLGKVADKSVGLFSKGMKQKVCLARTFVHDPSVLFLDEPTSGLDVSATKALDEFILGEKAQGKTIIYSSHIMSEVEKLCDRISIIHRGELIACGKIEELKLNDRKTGLEEVFLRLVGESR